MALHFSGNQFEQAYKPKVLRNWEVPKIYNDKPRKRSGRTQIIANDRGHLLPGVPKSKGSPWGNFLGTWHLPKKIDRKKADELNGTFNKRLTCDEKKRHETEEEPKKIEEEKEEEIKEEEIREIRPTEVPHEIKEENKENTCPYVPGDLTDDQHKLHYEIVPQNPPKGYPRYRDDFSQPLHLEKTLTRDDIETEYQKHKTMSEQFFSPKNGTKNRSKPPSPIIAAIKNFQLAKKLHRENLEHDPLPDTITNRKYRQLQMQRSQEPGLALKNENFATGVGWKGYPGYGPTRCTKLKVYRPKTCGHVDKTEKNDGRPSSVTSFDLKWRFIRRRKVSPIELAICWDLSPENPQDEPKRTPHIDGSNGSLAPAVFSLVHTSKEELRKSSVDSGPLFEKAPSPHGKDFILDRAKPSGESLAAKRAKSATNLNCSHDEGGNLNQSTPNLSECGDIKVKKCMACEMRNVSLKDKRIKDEYKMAFKAGVPHKCKDKRQDYPEHWRLATVYQHSYKPIHARKRPLLDTVFK
ncbi:uncharacterized protein LOC103312526 isoform X2 [Tribolium castaneum]|uniref:uncharacterized protein LOC103312526 isoform X2 n=1 Tax=Tribolium castaneum TaxID=7070 RepID=UPI00077DE8D9|nr:PREDICTED: uncharacterized protein LOC103312526 isoform X2 [Tribolium castaneum]|eukprot:XP_008191580.2 PREDICTED: uncharacterized protein LOC103312526 isoform X2 [Tribolium castaneum]